jgi:hypothetical protein
MQDFRLDVYGAFVPPALRKPTAHQQLKFIAAEVMI